MENIEPICEAVHKAYCEERIRQEREPYWTGGDYSKLDEATKDYDRKTVIAVLSAVKFEHIQSENKQMKSAIEEAIMKRGQYREIIEALLVPTNFIGIEAARDYICEALESYGLAEVSKP